ncbi:MAG: hypothetical protein V4524_03385 [Patescibacteria group bacterium]
MTSHRDTYGLSAINIANLLLKEISKLDFKSGFSPSESIVIQNFIGWTDFIDMLNKENLITNTQVSSYKRGEKQQIASQDTQNRVLYLYFDADMEKLKAYLINFIDTNGGDRVKICLESNYGLYVQGKREEYYRLKSSGKSKKSFLLVSAFLSKEILLGSEIQAITKYEDRSNIYLQCKRINSQLKKRCNMTEPLIIKISQGTYAINDKYVLEAVN